MTTVSFPYEKWNDFKDILLEHPGGTEGFAAVNAMLELRLPSGNDLSRSSIGPMVQEVEELLAGCLEWLRFFGSSPEDVQSRVAAAKIRKTSSQKSQEMKNARKAIMDTSDPQNGAARLETSAGLFVDVRKI